MRAAACIEWLLGTDRYGRRVMLRENGKEVEIRIHPSSQQDDGEVIRSLDPSHIIDAARILSGDVQPRAGRAGELERRVAKLEKWSHVPYDFSSLIERIERLEEKAGACGWRIEAGYPGDAAMLGPVDEVASPPSVACVDISPARGERGGHGVPASEGGSPKLKGGADR